MAAPRLNKRIQGWAAPLFVNTISNRGRRRRAAPTVRSELADDGDRGVVACGAAEGETDAIVALDVDRVG